MHALDLPVLCDLLTAVFCQLLSSVGDADACLHPTCCAAGCQLPYGVEHYAPPCLGQWFFTPSCAPCLPVLGDTSLPARWEEAGGLRLQCLCCLLPSAQGQGCCDSG